MKLAVTGASGYVASWVVHELLSRGHTVHGTVRDPSRADKVAHLRTLAAELPGELVLFAADLLKPGSFREAFEGCEVVIHTASPFHLDGGDPQTTLVDPALEGTRCALADADATESVKRVVLTSSVAAVYGDAAECAKRGGLLDESHWNESSRLDHMPYPYSKTVAERAAWEIAGAQSRWKLVVVNPGFVMGPSLSKRKDGASAQFMIDMATGRFASGTWAFMTPWVDVRDVAVAHAEAALREDADGRHILSCGEHSLMHVGRIIDEAPGDFRPPVRAIPRWLAWCIGPWLGYTREYVSQNVGHPVAMDAGKSRAALGMVYRPLEETVNEHLEQLARDGHI